MYERTPAIYNCYINISTINQYAYLNFTAVTCCLHLHVIMQDNYLIEIRNLNVHHNDHNDEHSDFEFLLDNIKQI